MSTERAVTDYLAHAERWPEAIEALRPILLDAGLQESIKWAKPCYDHDGANICIIQEMKAFLALMFFKGALVDDPDGLLHDQGPNSRSARRLQFTSVDEVVAAEEAIRAMVASAVRVEAAGLQVEPAPELELVDELRERLADDDALREAFEGLTPGRRREYNLHISSAKKAETRVARVEACVPRILDGRGLRDR